MLAISDRDLVAASVAGLPSDWRLAIAYNAALQTATAALAAAGYRASRENHHYRVIQSLEYTLGPDRKIIEALDAFRKKRNTSNYDIPGFVSEREAQQMMNLAADLRARVEEWIRQNHPALLKK